MSVETEKVGLANGRAPARRLRWRVLAVLAAINLVAVGLVSAPSQAQITSCGTLMVDQTIDGTLVVPSGSFCELQNVVVTGRVTVSNDGNLFMDGSRIMGSLTAEGGTFSILEFTDSRVDGMTTLGQNVFLNSYATRYNRLVEVQGGGLNSVDSTHWGGIRSVGGETIVRGGFVVGSVSTDQDFRTDLSDTFLFGPITVRNATTGTIVCELGAALSVTANGNSDIVQVGNGPYQPCDYNLLGSLTINNNTADIHINRNFIGGNLECTGNNPPPHGSFNLVGGARIDQCANLTPAPAPESMGLSELEAPPRDDHILAIIAQLKSELPR